MRTMEMTWHVRMQAPCQPKRMRMQAKEGHAWALTGWSAGPHMLRCCPTNIAGTGALCAEGWYPPPAGWRQRGATKQPGCVPLLLPLLLLLHLMVLLLLLLLLVMCFCFLPCYWQSAAATTTPVLKCLGWDCCVVDDFVLFHQLGVYASS